MNRVVIPLKRHPSALLLGCVFALQNACGGPTAGEEGATTTAETGVYAFESRFDPGVESAAYRGQILRHVLIQEMKGYLSSLTSRIDAGYTPAPGEVETDLLFYLDTVADVGDLVELESVAPDAEQVTFGDLSSGKNLLEKLAGNDPLTDHRDWSSSFDGWVGPATTSPEQLVRLWFAEIDEASVKRASGEAPTSAVYLTPDGIDRQQLLEKFLTGAVTFAQGTDDYLDWQTEAKGLLSDNIDRADEGHPYTDLEHAWDEGFGYFGANRSYSTMSDEDIVSLGGLDFNQDGVFDLCSEWIWGAAKNAARRDLGSVVETDLSQQAFTAFWGGRQLISDLSGNPSASQLDSLKGFARTATSSWEMSISATVVHYINATLVDLEAAKAGMADGEDRGFTLEAYAKHWSEAKGFALWFQFNPHSPMDRDTFVDLHDLLGSQPGWAPDTDGSDIDEAVLDLLSARDLLCEVYAFEESNCASW